MKAPPQALSRLAAGTLGGWLFVFGQTALGVAATVRLGALPFEDAESLFVLLAFPAYVAVFSWAFVTRLARTAWAVLIGGGALMTMAGWLLARGRS